MKLDWNLWERRFSEKIEKEIAIEGNDPAHDLAHFRRVVATAKHLSFGEKACLEIVIPAAWLHDLINVPKNDPRRSQASRLSAKAAIRFLENEGYPTSYLDEIAHAIEAHSFSAQIEPTTIEAQIVQDADRLDGLGAIGIARVFAVSGLLRRKLYHVDDPFHSSDRPLNDLEFTLDHFYQKLFKTASTLRTQAGREEGERRIKLMQRYLLELGRELGIPPEFVKSL
jgi:uncharacterized protein